MHYTISISTHVCAFAIDHIEPESEIREEEIHGASGGPQMSSCDDANIVVIKISPGAFNH
jgi:hypothetical protein